MMRWASFLRIGTSALFGALLLSGVAHAQVSGGVTAQGNLGTGNCIQSAGPGTIKSTGAPCGTGGTGTVTSVGVSGGTTGLTTSGGPVTTNGTITVGGTLGAANGGTGNTAYGDGQLLIGSSADSVLHKATLTAGTNVTITNGNGAITIAASGGSGTGCTTSGTAGFLLTDNGAGGCSSNSNATFATGLLSLGTSGSQAGQLKLFGGTSGSTTFKAAAIAGATTITFPGGTTDFSATGGSNQVVKQASAGAAFTVGTINCAFLSDSTSACSTAIGTSGATVPLLNGANTWSGVQSFSSSDLVLKGSVSGTITLNAAGTAGSNTITLPAGTTDFSATGGTNQVVKQNTSGGAFTVGTIACAFLSDSSTGCSTTVGTAATANTGTSGATLPFLNGTNTWSGVQSINSGDLALKGATSGTITLNAAATAGSNTITLPAGTTDFSATGGTSQVIKQTGAGAAFTVARLACADLSDSGSGCTGSGGGQVWGGVKSGAFNAAANTVYCVDTSGGAVTATLPGSPSDGDHIVFLDCARSWSTHILTLGRNTKSIAGSAADFDFNASGAVPSGVWYNLASTNWVLGP